MMLKAIQQQQQQQNRCLKCITASYYYLTPQQSSSSPPPSWTTTTTSISNYHTTTRHFAGHNKWSKIKHKKGAKDLNKNKLFSKATKAIRVASRKCNGDFENLHLQSAIQAAKALQVPKDRIQDAITNTKTRGGEEEQDPVLQRYDGNIVTPSGKVSIIALALTANKNRTAANVRSFLRKANGDLLSTGANDWFFDHLGIVLVKKHKNEDNRGNSNDSIYDYNEEIVDNDKDGDNSIMEPLSEEMQDALMECALDGRATDVDFGSSSDTDQHVMLKCEPTDLHPLVMAMKRGGYVLSQFETAYLVKDEEDGGQHVLLDDEESVDLLETFMEKMDEDDDVDQIYHNATFR